MKWFIILSLTLIPTIVIGQIQVREIVPESKVGEVKYVGGKLLAEITYQIIDKDTVYKLLYDNAEYKTLTVYNTVKFGSSDGTLDQFYNIMKSVFKEENKKNKEYKVQFQLGETEVIVSTVRMMGVSSAMFFTTKGYTTFTEKQVDKLFGK